MAAKNTKKKTDRAEERDLDTKIQFMEGVLRRDPEYVDALQLLGDHYTQRGRFVDGLQVDEQLARLMPENPIVFYNLACSYSLTDRFERAALALADVQLSLHTRGIDLRRRPVRGRDRIESLRGELQ